MTENVSNSYYWDKSVLSALMNDKDRSERLVSLLHRGKDHQIHTSVLAVAMVIHEMRKEEKPAETAEQLFHTWMKEGRLLQVSCHEQVSAGVTDLLTKADSEGWDLDLLTSIELATADWVKCSRFYTFNTELNRFLKITSTRFGIQDIEGELSEIAVQTDLDLVASSAKENSESPDQSSESEDDQEDDDASE